jgi:hypothetical protein
VCTTTELDKHTTTEEDTHGRGGEGARGPHVDGAMGPPWAHAAHVANETHVQHRDVAARRTVPEQTLVQRLRSLVVWASGKPGGVRGHMRAKLFGMRGKALVGFDSQDSDGLGCTCSSCSSCPPEPPTHSTCESSALSSPASHENACDADSKADSNVCDSKADSNVCDSKADSNVCDSKADSNVCDASTCDSDASTCAPRTPWTDDDTDVTVLDNQALNAPHGTPAHAHRGEEGEVGGTAGGQAEAGDVPAAMSVEGHRPSAGGDGGGGGSMGGLARLAPVGSHILSHSFSVHALGFVPSAVAGGAGGGKRGGWICETDRFVDGSCVHGLREGNGQVMPRGGGGGSVGAGGDVMRDVTREGKGEGMPGFVGPEGGKGDVDVIMTRGGKKKLGVYSQKVLYVVI